MKCKKGLSDNPMVCDTNYVEPEPDPEPEPEKPKSCDDGHVYVNGECVSCASHQEWIDFAKEARMYCPGGEVPKDSNGNYLGPLKQLKKCPPLEEPNENLDKCVCMYRGTRDANTGKCVVKSLSHEDIYYGPLGKEGTKGALHKQCWTKRTKSAYRKCMGFDN